MTEYVGSCHCQAVRFTARTALEDPVRCNCSFCVRRGAVLHNVRPEDFRLVAGEDALRHYTFNTGTVRHSFCGTCGIFTFFHSRYAGDETYVINVGCLEGVDSYAMQTRLVDGAAY